MTEQQYLELQCSRFIVDCDLCSAPQKITMKNPCGVFRDMILDLMKLFYIETCTEVDTIHLPKPIEDALLMHHNDCGHTPIDFREKAVLFGCDVIFDSDKLIVERRGD